MIECIRFIEINKGSLRGYADFFIDKMGLEIFNCTYHVKGSQHWINMPNKEIGEVDGKKKYLSFIRFRKREHADAFSKAAIEAIEKKIKQNQLSKPQEINKISTMEIPF